MNKLFKTCVSSMNYFLLKEVFSDKSIMNNYVMLELCSYLEDLAENLTPEIEEIIAREMDESGYLDNLTLDEVRTKFEKVILEAYRDDCYDCEDISDMVDIYVNIAEEIMKKHHSEDIVKVKYNLKKLAKKISHAAKEISKDSIYKDYLIEKTDKDTIYVTSDGGFQGIIVGNTDGIGKSNGWMYLWHKNACKGNEFPTTDEIERLLQDVVEEKTLEEGENKASYNRWDEYGSLDRQKKYFSEIVKRMASSNS